MHSLIHPILADTTQAERLAAASRSRRQRRAFRLSLPRLNRAPRTRLGLAR